MARGTVDEATVWNCTSVLALEEHYGRRARNYETVAALYEGSNVGAMIGDLKVPFVFINTLDDPIVPSLLWAPIQRHCREHPLHAFILLKHGGHLGFLEGPCLHPHSVTWIDKFIIQLADAVTGVVEGVE